MQSGLSSIDAQLPRNIRVTETTAGDMALAQPELKLFRNLDAAEADWLSLEGPASGPPYQSFRWLKAWHETIGQSRHIEPVIARGRIEGRTVVLLPLGMERKAGIRTLSFLGHQNGNQNTGCWDETFHAEVTADCMDRFLKEICAQAGADLLTLQNIPAHWLGRPHPLVPESATVSPSPIFVRSLGDDFETLFRNTHSKSSRKNLLRKQRHLQELEGYRVAKATTPEEIRRGLSAFFPQRARRASESGIPNAFSTPEAQDFITRLATDTSNEAIATPPSLVLWFLEVGGIIRATYLCAEKNGTIHAYSNSVAHDELLSNSPGLVLIKEIIAGACETPELKSLDLGLGEERYKTAWAEPLALRDSLVAITVKGRLKLAVALAATRARSAVRNSEHLWQLVRAIRKWKARLTGRHSG